MANQIKKEVETNRKSNELAMIQQPKPDVSMKYLVNPPETIHPEHLVGSKPPKRDMPSRTQSTSDASRASDNKDS